MNKIFKTTILTLAIMMSTDYVKASAPFVAQDNQNNKVKDNITLSANDEKITQTISTNTENLFNAFYELINCEDELNKVSGNNFFYKLIHSQDIKSKRQNCEDAIKKLEIAKSKVFDINAKKNNVGFLSSLIDKVFFRTDLPQSQAMLDQLLSEYNDFIYIDNSLSEIITEWVNNKCLHINYSGSVAKNVNKYLSILINHCDFVNKFKNELPIMETSLDAQLKEFIKNTIVTRYQEDLNSLFKCIEENDLKKLDDLLRNKSVLSNKIYILERFFDNLDKNNPKYDPWLKRTYNSELRKAYNEFWGKVFNIVCTNPLMFSYFNYFSPATSKIDAIERERKINPASLGSEVQDLEKHIKDNYPNKDYNSVTDVIKRLDTLLILLTFPLREDEVKVELRISKINEGDKRFVEAMEKNMLLDINPATLKPTEVDNVRTSMIKLYSDLTDPDMVQKLNPDRGDEEWEEVDPELLDKLPVIDEYGKVIYRN